ncbi:MAG: hypothetical protein V4631_14800 [Pseudomonadota bacterium]
MSSFVPHTLLTALLISTSLVGCSDKKAESVVVQEGAHADAAERPLVDYWKPVSAELAGSYGGSCTSKPEGKQEAANIVIAPDGKFTVPGYSNSLVTSAQTSLTHKRTEGGASTLMVEGIGTDFFVKLSSGDDGQGSTAVFGKAPSTLSCEKSTQAIALTGKNLYELYAKQLDAAPRNIYCVKVGALKTSDLNFQFSNGVAKLHDDSFELGKMNEYVMLMNASSVLSYTASTDADEINVVLDKHGKLISVQAKGKSGQVYSCPVEA